VTNAAKYEYIAVLAANIFPRLAVRSRNIDDFQDELEI
jgi:hypothetical protein